MKRIRHHLEWQRLAALIASRNGPPSSTFTVRVEDAAGQGVKGVRVQFRASSPNFTFNYLDPSTDSTGVVFAGVIYGTVAGPAVLSATADGVSAPAVVNVLVVPGPPTYVRVSPGTLRLFEAGDSASFTAYVVEFEP